MTVAIPQSNATLALDDLFTAISTGTAARLDPAPQCLFGWHEAVKQIAAGNRVVLQPGDPGGKLGELIGAKLPGRNPPPIATLNEIATLFLWGYDSSAPTNTQAQWRMTRRLHDVVIPICVRTFRGRWKQLSASWVQPTRERMLGAELQIVFAVEAMIPDDLVPVAPGGTVTTIDTTIAANGGTPRPC